MTYQSAALSALVLVVSASTALAQTRFERGVAQAPVQTNQSLRTRGPNAVPAIAQVFPRAVDDALVGGVQLDIQPWRAQVFVNGERKGAVEDFRGYFQHLSLPAGFHVIAIVAPNYEPRIIEVMVFPGRTISIHETLTYAYGR